MDNSRQATAVLAGTARTGSLVARKLAGHGLNARTASLHGADVPFNWDNEFRRDVVGGQSWRPVAGGQHRCREMAMLTSGRGMRWG